MNQNILSLIIQNADTKEVIFSRSQIPKDTADDLELDWQDECFRKESEVAEGGSVRNYIIYSKFPPAGFSYRTCQIRFTPFIISKTYAGTTMFDEEEEIPYDCKVSDPIRLDPSKFPINGAAPSFDNPKELTHELAVSDIQRFIKLIQDGAKKAYPPELFATLLDTVNRIDAELAKVHQSMIDEYDENDRTVGGELMLFLDLGIAAWKQGGKKDVIPSAHLSKHEKRIQNVRYRKLLEESITDIIEKA